MYFTDFSNKITQLKTATLGGKEVQFKLVPKLRLQYSDDQIKERKPKIAAVLALFYPNENNETCFLLTERASYKGVHSRQVSFPGGKVEKKDPTLAFTALRETQEEVGLHPSNIKIIREITNVYIPPSNFLATPFLAYSEKKPIFTTNNEVENVIEVLVSDLLNTANISSKILATSYMKKLEVPCFKLNSYIVWGATAMILAEIKDLLER